VYAGTKAYVDFFSNSVAEEAKEYANVLTVHPGLVITNMTEKTKEIDAHSVANKTKKDQPLYKITVQKASRGILSSMGRRNTSICFIHWAFTLILKMCSIRIRGIIFKH